MEEVILDHASKADLAPLVSLLGSTPNFFIFQKKNDLYLISGFSRYFQTHGNDLPIAHLNNDYFISINDKVEGVRISTSGENTQKMIRKYHQGVQCGKEINYYRMGREIYHYDNGERNGIYEKIYQNRVVERGFYVDGRKRGIWEYWDLEGKLLVIKVYGENEGFHFATYHPNGKVMVNGMMKRGNQRIGDWYYFDQEGIMKEHIKYENNNVIFRETVQGTNELSRFYFHNFYRL